MKKKLFFKVTGFFLVTLFFASCASSTLIQSYPSGAKVYINGVQAGRTPYWHTDTNIIGSVTDIDLVKEGYEPFYTSISRDEQVDVGAIIGGFCFGVPFLWSLRYYPTHSYELVPSNQSNKNNEIVSRDSNEVKPQISLPKIQRLKELKQMLDENLINKEDFEKQKQQILNEM